MKLLWQQSRSPAGSFQHEHVDATAVMQSRITGSATVDEPWHKTRLQW
jgi:hypothetical protein